MEELTAQEVDVAKWRLGSRWQLYLSLSLVQCLPLFLTLSLAAVVEEVGALIVVAVISLGISLFLASILLRGWERRVRLRAQEVIHQKCRDLDDVPLLQERELAKLKEHFEHMQRGYEQQVDLLQKTVEKSQDQIASLNVQMDKKLEEMRIAYLEFEDLRKEYHRLEEEHRIVQNEVVEKQEHKESLIADYQHTIYEQRMILEKKQRYINKLESKVRDLMYEIRSLLQLEEAPTENIPPIEASREELSQHYVSPSIPQPSHDAEGVLKRYLNLAESFTGADHLTRGLSRLYDPAVGSYAIDMRRLFDSLRDETAGVIVVYSQMEARVVFTSTIVRTLLGWSSDKFSHDFTELVNYPVWRKGLSDLANKRLVKKSLTVVNRRDEQVMTHCLMGMIQKGPFAHHVIGLLIKI